MGLDLIKIDERRRKLVDPGITHDRPVKPQLYVAKRDDFFSTQPNSNIFASEQIYFAPAKEKSTQQTTIQY